MSKTENKNNKRKKGEQRPCTHVVLGEAEVLLGVHQDGLDERHRRPRAAVGHQVRRRLFSGLQQHRRRIKQVQEWKGPRRP